MNTRLGTIGLICASTVASLTVGIHTSAAAMSAKGAIAHAATSDTAIAALSLADGVAAQSRQNNQPALKYQDYSPPTQGPGSGQPSSSQGSGTR